MTAAAGRILSSCSTHSPSAVDANCLDTYDFAERG